MKQVNRIQFETIIWFSILLTLAVNPFLIVPSIKDNFVLPKEIFINFFTAVSFCLWSLHAIREEKVVLLKSTTTIFLLLFFLSQIISISHSQNFYETNRRLFFSLSLVLCFFITSTVKKEKFIYSFIEIIIITSSITAFIAILQYLEIKILPDNFYTQNEWKYKAFSTLGNPQFLASFLLIAFPLSINLLLYKKQKIYYSLSSFFIGLGLLVTNTRGALFCAALSILFLLVLTHIHNFRFFKIISPKKTNFFSNIIAKNKLLLLLITMFIIYLAFSFSYTKQNRRVPTIIKQFKLLLPKNNTSVGGRIFTWKIAAEMIKDHPYFGISLGNFKIKYPHYKSQVIANIKEDITTYPKDFFSRKQYTHNEYLQIWVETGVFSLIFFLAFLTAYFWNTFKAIKKLEKQHQAFLLGIISSIVGVILFSIIFFPLQIPSTGFAFFLLLGSSLAFINIQLNQSFNKEAIFAKSLGRKFLFGEIIFLFFIFLSIANFKLAKSAYCLKKSESLIKEKKYIPALTYIIKGIKTTPDRGELHYAAGFIYFEKNLFKEAIESFHTALSLLPEKGIYYSLGNLYLKQKNYRLSIINYQNAIAIDPSFADAYLNLGIAYMHTKNYTLAIQNFKKANVYAEEDILIISSLNNLANCYFLLGHKEEARKFWKRMLRQLKSNQDISLPGIEKIKEFVRQ